MHLARSQLLIDWRGYPFREVEENMRCFRSFAFSQRGTQRLVVYFTVLLVFVLLQGERSSIFVCYVRLTTYMQ